MVGSSTLSMSDDVMLKSTKVQIPDFLAVAQVISSHPVAVPLQADPAVIDNDNILTNAQLYQAAFSLPL